MTKLRDQLIRIHNTYRQNVKLVRENLGYNRGVEIYAKDYSRNIKTYDSVSSKTDLIKKVLAANLVFHARTKHIKVDHHFVQELVAQRQLHVRFLPLKEQLADIFTKGLPWLSFLHIRDKLLVRSRNHTT